MDKQEKIRSLHKILFIKEDIDGNKNNVSNKTLESYITNCCVRFKGVDMEDSLRDKIVETLVGLKEYACTMSHEDVKSIILGLMNDIDRRE